jgi:NADH dehydrogenase
VIVGGGFGGLAAAKALRRTPADLTVVDRRNFHLFQPLLYQVATGSLSTGDIASPLRAVLKRQPNTTVAMAEVEGFDLVRRRVLLGSAANREADGALAYDTLIVAAGARHSYFGRDEREQWAPGMKTIEQAERIRQQMLLAFEAAELESDAARRAQWLSFVVIGAGPTGVELAGQIAEIAQYTLRRDFRRIDPREARVYLVEGGDRVLPSYVPKLSAKAQRSLEGLGVTVILGGLVDHIDAETVQIGAGRVIAARTKIWAAGVQASPLAAQLAHAAGASVDRAGRVTVAPDMSLPGYPEVFIVGDMVQIDDGAGGVQPWPGIAQPAIQAGAYVGTVINARLKEKLAPPPFRYRDKGSLATIGRARAVADVRGLRVSGLLAWLTWLVVHITFLVGMHNRLIVLTRWARSFVTHGRSQRLITGEAIAADFERVGLT